MPRTRSIKLRRQWSMNTATPMPSWRSSGPLMRMALMILFVKPRKLIQILTFPNSTLTHRPKPLLNLSPLRALRICLLNQAQPVNGDVHLPVNVEENIENMFMLCFVKHVFVCLFLVFVYFFYIKLKKN